MIVTLVVLVLSELERCSSRGLRGTALAVGGSVEEGKLVAAPAASLRPPAGWKRLRRRVLRLKACPSEVCAAGGVLAGSKKASQSPSGRLRMPFPATPDLGSTPVHLLG